jgi:ABC-type dipeptide/oligopeptide/nickel transport system ATPase component
MTEDGSDSPPLLSVRDLQVSLGHPRIEAVRGVSFSIQPGEILGLAGESGSGKSVASLSLTRLLPGTARARYGGSVQLAGVPGNLLTLNERRLRRLRGRRIACIFQEPSSSFNPVHTIGTHFAEVLRVRGVPASEHRERMLRALEEVEISPDREHLDAYPGNFSGGMLQRAAIACSLLGSPDLLLADEPTTALDTTTQKRITDLLVRLNRQTGMSILFISHDLGLLKQFTRRLLVMRQGTIVESGPTESLLQKPAHPYTRELLAALPKLRLPTG